MSGVLFIVESEWMRGKWVCLKGFLGVGRGGGWGSAWEVWGLWSGLRWICVWRIVLSWVESFMSEIWWYKWWCWWCICMKNLTKHTFSSLCFHLISNDFNIIFFNSIFWCMLMNDYEYMLLYVVMYVYVEHAFSLVANLFYLIDIFIHFNYVIDVH